MNEAGMGRCKRCGGTARATRVRPDDGRGRTTLAAVDALCAELTARRYLAWWATTAELAAKYGIGERTVTNWRRKGRHVGNMLADKVRFRARWSLVFNRQQTLYP